MGLPLDADGGDSVLRVNHLGPYLLTRLLLPALAPHARVVFVASRAHQQALRLRVAGGRVQGTPPHWRAPAAARGAPARVACSLAAHHNERCIPLQR
jgi:NAD(P)-dependent dehydrogenase (short-subunit alcohol dehydrogenase family)